MNPLANPLGDMINFFKQFSKFNILERVFNYINTIRPYRDIVYRKELLPFNRRRNSYTVDNYICMLKNTGYLNTIKPGQYQIIKKIPEMSKRQMMWKVYPETMQREKDSKKRGTYEYNGKKTPHESEDGK